MQKEGRKVIAIGLIVFMVLAMLGTITSYRSTNIFLRALDVIYQYSNELFYNHVEFDEDGAHIYYKNKTDRNNSSNDSEQESNSNDNGVPSLPEGNDESGQSIDNPPSLNDDMMGGKSNSDQESNTPPSKPGDESNSDQESNTPPSMPGDESNSDQESNTPPSMPDGEQGMSGEEEQGTMEKQSSQEDVIILYVTLGIESLTLLLSIAYLIMSKGGKFSIRESFKGTKKKVITILIVVVGTGLLTTGCGCLTLYAIAADNTAMDNMQGQSGSSVEATGVVIVDGSQKDVTNADASSTADQSVVVVKNGGEANISGTINKASGDGSNTENSEFYGINSGILAQKESTANIKDAAITTAAECSNAVFASGEDAYIKISDSTIKTTGKRSSRGLDATYGGKIDADNVTIETAGGSCATLATDRGEGTVSAKNCKLTTNGAGSPIIYSTGDISIDNTTGTANKAQMVVVEGKNTATVKNSSLVCSGAGNRGENVDGCGIMIYQSMSGDAGEGVGTFTAESSNLSVNAQSDYYKTVPMFFVTNTDAVINLKNSKLNFGSGTLLNALGTDQWGKEGQNGGNVEFNADNQALQGNIIVDSISTVNMTLKNGSTYEGTINGDKTAKEIKLTLDKNSTLKLTGDCYVSNLDNADSSNSNIDFNGHKLYVNGSAIN